jgi:muramoyltetrapeptide carboxypeptidase
VPGQETLRGPALEPGDRVRLVSPSSRPTEAELGEAVDLLESCGLQVEVGAHALDAWGYMAGRDDDRLADLNDAFRDPEVRAVIATRGGAGAYRIADRIDFDAVRADPKPLVGFSDITNLHLALWTHARLATIHGGLAGRTAARCMHRLLMHPAPLTIPSNPTAVSAAVGVAGRAEGPLVGGNLRELVGWIGAGLELTGAIVLLEDLRHVGIGQVDRHLTHLIRSGALADVAGLALGSFEDFSGYTDRGWSVIDVLRDRLGSLGVPVLGGLDLGHRVVESDGGPDPYAATLGATAQLDDDSGTLTVGACVRGSPV